MGLTTVLLMLLKVLGRQAVQDTSSGVLIPTEPSSPGGSPALHPHPVCRHQQKPEKPVVSEPCRDQRDKATSVTGTGHTA